MVIRELSDGIAVSVKVQPRASRNQIIGQTGESIKVHLNAPPVDGAANAACIELFSDILKLPKSSIHLLSGHKSRNKIIKIEGLDKHTFLAITHVELDKN